MRGRLLAFAGSLIGFAVGLVVTGLVVLLRREYLPEDPGYRVRLRLDPSGPTSSIDAPAHIAVLGDSTVAGVGSPTARQSLPAQLAQRVAHALGRSVRVVGFGIPGARTVSVLRDQLPQVEPVFDAVVVVVGSNDVTHATPWPALRHQTREMLDGALRVAPLVVLAGTPRFKGTLIIPQPLRFMADRYSAVLRRQQRSAVEERSRVRFVDIAANASPRFVGVPEATSEDGFHPSVIGYGFWADAIAVEVAAALTQEGPQTDA